ncbi:MAG: FecR domain-containing protein [Bryobacteraceae bacterium]|nr:FecR domain-containing protein [Bryobacteraceae bacterium]
MMNDEQFDDLLNEIQASDAPREMAEAKERVRAKLGMNPACAEFRPELAQYTAGTLEETRRLLVEDHLSRCAGCRGIYGELTGERPKVIAMPAKPARKLPSFAKWAIAAGVAALSVWAAREPLDKWMAPSGARATLAMGELIRVDGRQLKPGDSIDEGDVVRSGRGVRPRLRLADGSQLEMNERSELYVTAAWSGQTVHLERGDVLIQAAKQRRGYLKVATQDSVTSVKGTVFSVSTGLQGSLVTVIEGAVQVDKSGGGTLLKPGEHTATSAALETVTPTEAVAWSEDARKYIQLLAELAVVEQRFAALPAPALRTNPQLLAYLPANTMVYGSVPNLGGPVDQIIGLMDQRARESAVLREWWNSGAMVDAKQQLTKLQALTPLIGDEMVFGLTSDGNNSKPLLVMGVKAGQRAALQAKLDQTFTGVPHMAYTVTDQFVLMTGEAKDLAPLQGAATKLSATPFGNEIRARYAKGAGWLLGVNIELATLRSGTSLQQQASMVTTGINRMKHLFLEQKQVGSASENSALLSFNGPRTGLASWLASPAATAAGEYISPDALVAGSITTGNPRELFNSLLDTLSKLSPDAINHLREFERKTGVNFANDIAGALGTDYAYAVETPTLPIPGWIAVAEVYRQASLDESLRRFVEAFNRESPSAKLTLKTETTGGRTWTTITASSAPGMALQMTYDRGYLLLSSDRAIITRAIQTRPGGFPLVRSAKFRNQLPSGAGMHQSAFLWINTSEQVRQMLSSVVTGQLATLLQNREPLLVLVNGETERISAASRNRITSMLFDMLLAGVAGGDQPRQAPRVLGEKKAQL